MQIVQRTSCRICGSKVLTPIISLGNQALASAFVMDGSSAALPEREVPLELVRCDPGLDENACGLVQLRHSYPKELIYGDYWYQSGVNQTMRDALAEIMQRVKQFVPLASGDIVVDIGCNDGTMLRSCDADGVRCIGFDPASNLAGENEPFVRVTDFFSAEAFRRISGESARAKAVTSIAMFYDLEDPAAFVREVAAILHPDGVWIVQFADLPGMLTTNMYDNICHEHLLYLHLAPMERILDEAGLRLVDLEMNEVNGSSYRLFVRHKGARATAEGAARVQARRIAEFNMRLDQPAVYDRFSDAVLSNRYALRYLLHFLKREGKLVVGYGASTKGNVILQYCNISPDLLPCLADRNPRKHGARTLGTDIPIVSEEEARAMAPDYFLVLPYHFLPEMLEREKAFLGRGGRFIVPVPTIQLVP
jgi:C-methyltransferase-like protein/methyltransferase family protein/putative zinc binding protein